MEHCSSLGLQPSHPRMHVPSDLFASVGLVVRGNGDGLPAKATSGWEVVTVYHRTPSERLEIPV